MKRTLLSALAVYSALLSWPASAQQFTFITPIEVRNLPPNIEKMHVACSLYTGTPLRTVGDPTTGGVAVSIPQVPTAAGGTAGEFVGDVISTRNVLRGVDPAQVTHYSCRIASLEGTQDGERVFYFDITNPDISPRIPVAAGTTLRIETGIQPLPR